MSECVLQVCEEGQTATGAVGAWSAVVPSAARAEVRDAWRRQILARRDPDGAGGSGARVVVRARGLVAGRASRGVGAVRSPESGVRADNLGRAVIRVARVATEDRARVALHCAGAVEADRVVDRVVAAVRDGGGGRSGSGGSGRRRAGDAREDDEKQHGG